jgi:hypothetical protein
LPHRSHLGGALALATTYALIAGLSIVPQTRPAAAVLMLIPDPVVYGAGMVLARDWGHADPSALDVQVEQARLNLEQQFCGEDDQPWWCL